MSSFSVSEVSRHNSESDCWIIVDNQVYDVTKFLNDHPGGKKVLVQVAGQDATKKFHLFHKPAVLVKYGPQLLKGTLTAAGPSSTSSSSFPKAPKSSSIQPGPTAFGELVPYGDPSWYQEWHSPYYQPHHRLFRSAIREFVEREIMPNCYDWDEAKQIPKDLFRKFYQGGWLPGVVGVPFPTEYVGSRVGGGITPEQFDHFCELILTDEVARCGSGGVVWGLFGGLSIGLPPVMKFGSQYLKDKVCRSCLTGEKVICLAITEPYAGSDVANLQTTAKLSEDGKDYLLNGEKKWITNGVFADFFTVACRTGGKGSAGLSLLLVERSMPGVTARQMNCQGVWSSGTTYLTFEDVKVPVENLIGKPGEGFKYIMHNFNHERWSICIEALRFARVCLEEAMKYSFKRKTFGKLLIEHPVIRLKLAHMARQVEATFSQLENITYQMSVMSFKEQNATLGGPIALCKAQATTVFEYCAREAAQIFGGLAYTRGGQGEKVERLYREVRAYAIPGGSEEIMLDLGIRQAIKPYTVRLAAQTQQSKL